MKLKLKPKARNILSALLYPLAAALFIFLFGKIVYLFAEPPSGMTMFSIVASVPQIVVNIFSAIVMFVAMVYLCPRKYFRKNRSYTGIRSSAFGGLAALLFIAVFWGYAEKPFSRRIILLIGLLTAAVSQEIIFRFCTLNLWFRIVPKRKRERWTALCVAAFQFGIAHIITFQHSVNIWYSLMQIFTFSGIGLLFSTILCRTGSMCWNVFIKSIVECIYLLFSSGSEQGSFWGLLTGLAFYYIMLRISKNIFYYRPRKKRRRYNSSAAV